MSMMNIHWLLYVTKHDQNKPNKETESNILQKYK